MLCYYHSYVIIIHLLSICYSFVIHLLFLCYSFIFIHNYLIILSQVDLCRLLHQHQQVAIRLLQYRDYLQRRRHCLTWTSLLPSLVPESMIYAPGYDLFSHQRVYSPPHSSDDDDDGTINTGGEYCLTSHGLPLDQRLDEGLGLGLELEPGSRARDRSMSETGSPTPSPSTSPLRSLSARSIKGLVTLRLPSGAIFHAFPRTSLGPGLGPGQGLGPGLGQVMIMGKVRIQLFIRRAESSHTHHYSTLTLSISYPTLILPHPNLSLPHPFINIPLFV